MNIFPFSCVRSAGVEYGTKTVCLLLFICLVATFMIQPTSAQGSGGDVDEVPAALNLKATVYGDVSFVFGAFSVPYRPRVGYTSDQPDEIRLLAHPRETSTSNSAPRFGCVQYLSKPFDGTSWFDEALLQDVDASCSYARRIYHGSLIGLRLIVFYDVSISQLFRGYSSIPWTQYKFGNSTDRDLNVTQWLSEQPAGQGYGYTSPYPAPAVIFVQTGWGQMWLPRLRPFFASAKPGNINLTLPLPGILDATEHSILRDMAQSLQQTAPDFTFAGYGTLLPLTAVLNNPSANPCTMGLAGVTCDGSHIVSITWNFLGLTGTFPDSAAGLKKLKNLQISNNQLTSLSPAVCGLESLTLFDASVNRITSIPDCWCGGSDLSNLSNGTTYTRLDGSPWPLFVFNVGVNQMSNFPVSLLRCSQLSSLFLNNNKMSTPPVPNLVASNWQKLITLDMAGAGLTGSVPSFRGMAQLKTLRVGDNSFTGLVPYDTFDMLDVALSIIAPRLGSVSGSFPTLAVSRSSPPLQRLDLSENNFHGQIPSYNHFLVLQSYSLGGNRPLPPYDFMKDNINVQYLNMSHSDLSCEGYQDFTTFLLSILQNGNRIYEVYMNHNPRINCTWGDSWNAVSAPGSSIFAKLFKMNLAGCRLGSLPSGLFRTSAPQFWTTLDVSDNDLTGAAPAAPVPVNTITYLNFGKNPRMQRPTGSTNPDEVIWSLRTDLDPISTADGTMLCPQLAWKGSPLGSSFILDASYTGYEGCTCAPSYYGVPPACVQIPSTTSWSYDTTAEPTGVLPEADARTMRANVASEAAIDTSDAAVVPTLPSYIPSQTFTDGYFGGQRFTAGMLTTFSIGDVKATAAEDIIESDLSATAPAKVLTITIYLNPATFDSYTDTLTIYEGGDSLQGDRVFSVHGSDSVLKDGEHKFLADSLLNPADIPQRTQEEMDEAAFKKSLRYAETYGTNAPITVQTLDAKSDIFTSTHSGLKSSMLSNAPVSGTSYLDESFDSVELLHVFSVPVFSPTATIQFQSLDTAGVHFFATYTTSTRCPDGLHPSMESQKCFEVITSTDRVRTTVFVIGAFAVLITLISAIFVFIWRENNVIRAASAPFQGVITFFMLAMAGGSMLYSVLPYASESSAVVCDLRIWFTSVPLIGVLAVLLAKQSRVVTIFSARSLKSRKVTELDITQYIVVLLALQVMMCVIFSSLHLSEARLVPGTGSNTGFLVQQCTRESGFYSWLIAEIVFCGVLALWGAMLAFQTRDVLSAFNESIQNANAIFALIFIASIAIPVSILVHDQQDATVILQGISQSLIVIVWNLVLFAPKAYYIATGRVFQAVAAVRADVGGPKEVGKMNDPSPQPGAAAAIGVHFDGDTPIKSFHISDGAGSDDGGGRRVAPREGEESLVSNNPLSVHIGTRTGTVADGVMSGSIIRPLNSIVTSVPLGGGELRRDWYPGALASQLPSLLPPKSTIHFDDVHAAAEGIETPLASVVQPAVGGLPPIHPRRLPSIPLASRVASPHAAKSNDGSSSDGSGERSPGAESNESGSTPRPGAPNVHARGVEESDDLNSHRSSYHTANQLTARSQAYTPSPRTPAGHDLSRKEESVTFHFKQ